MELKSDTFKKIQSFLVEQSGVYLHKDQKDSFAEKALERVHENKLESFEEYLSLLKSHPRGRLEVRALLDRITIGETYFFRNEPHFEAFRNYVIPKLIEKKINKKVGNDISEDPDTKYEIRIWCAGCSTGEEPYTIAMILRNSLPNFESWKISILGTDVNRNFLNFARQGIYGQRSVSHVPIEFFDRYFEQHGQKYQLSDEIKQLVKFENHNLATDPYTLPGMTGLDVLFCRNVVIYFNSETCKRTISQFADCLSKDSYLFIGHAETLWGMSNMFEPIEFPQTFIYKKLSEPIHQIHALHIPLPAEVPSDLNIYAPGSIREVQHSTDLDVLMRKATEHANKGEYEKAMGNLKTIVEQDNLYTPAYYLMGVLLTKAEKYDEAINEFRRVLYINEKLAIGYYHLGNIYQFLDMLTLAKKEYKNCLQLLESMDEDAMVPFSEGLTVEVLRQATLKALECAGRKEVL